MSHNYNNIYTAVIVLLYCNIHPVRKKESAYSFLRITQFRNFWHEPSCIWCMWLWQLTNHLVRLC